MILKRGDRGEPVRRLQQALIDAGINVPIDGDFGPKTEAAVKEFQRRNGLSADGIAGPNTLQALNLDQKSGAEEIVFTPDETNLSPNAKERIREYVDLLSKRHDLLLKTSQDALAQFETTVRFASTKDAKPDLLGTLLSGVFDFAVDELFGRVGVLTTPLTFAKSLFTAVSDELARAGQASISQQVGDWIKDQRVAIDRLRGRLDQSELQKLQMETEADFLESEDRRAFFDDLFTTIEQLRKPSNLDVSAMERRLYEQWIKAHFREGHADGPGCIDIQFDSGFPSAVESCRVDAPEGPKIGDALNRLIDRNLVPGLTGPLDLKVIKRVCFFVPNLVGGKKASCGLLDEESRLFRPPLLPEGQKAIQNPAWRAFVKRFAV